MRKSVRPYALSLADDDFSWQGEKRPKLPKLYAPDGTLFQPAMMYFGYSAEIERVAISSMQAEAYAIREYLEFMHLRGSEYDQADDTSFSEFRESFAEDIKSKRISKRQVELKISRVFDFYRLLPRACPFDDKGEPRRILVGKPGDTSKYYPLSSKLRQGKRKTTIVWIGQKKSPKNISKPRVPSPLGVEKVMTYLRGKSDRAGVQVRPGWADTRVIEAERNWCIAATMAYGGLRRSEVSRLTLGALEECLVYHNILDPSLRPVGFIGSSVLDAIANDADLHDKILARLENFERNHNPHLYIKIEGKGDKERMAPWPVSLIKNILEIAVFSVRKRQLELWADGSSIPDHVFLSLLTKDKLSPGAIGNLIKQAFTDAKVVGSGHKLRAFYATNLAKWLLGEELSKNGMQYDQTIENLVLDQLAEACGHASPTTTLRHYVNWAAIEYFHRSNKGRRDNSRAIWKLLVRHRERITAKMMSILSTIITQLAKDGDDSHLLKFLLEISNDSDLFPSPKQKPKLQIVT